jgi:hypothetical protein
VRLPSTSYPQISNKGKEHFESIAPGGSYLLPIEILTSEAADSFSFGGLAVPLPLGEELSCGPA